jgi:1-acyl-sn-glycerol-3-phosphate acyltransferase
VAVNTGLYWGRRGFTRRPGVAVIEYLPVIQPGLARDDLLAQLQAKIEAASNRLIAEALAKDPSLRAALAVSESRPATV